MSNARIVALAAAALIFLGLGQMRPVLAEQTAPPPYSCRLYDDEQRKCAFGSCDHRALERLKRECLRDGGRP